MKWMAFCLIFLAGCATTQPVAKIQPPGKVSQGSGTGAAGTGNVTVYEHLDGRKDVKVDLVGKPIF